MPGKIIEPVLIDSFESLVFNFDEYVDRFKRDAVVVFRGSPISRSEQLQVTRMFGDVIGWYPNSSSWIEKVWWYEENHSQTMDKYNKHHIPKDEIFLPWHIEHIGHKNPAVGATWNMEKFTCDHGVGNTLFVNICDVYDLFSEEEKEFLKRCTVAAFYGWATDEYGKQQEPTLHEAVELHNPSGRFALRLNALFKYDRETFYLYHFDGREPSEAENSLFDDISLRFTKHIHHNEEILQTHMWQENDLVVVDLFLMAHAVMGGFRPSERFFHGMWAHRHPGSKYGLTDA